MLDVLHYLFEDDLDISTAEQIDAKSNVRTTLYREIYGTTYKYGQSTSGGNSGLENLDRPVNDAGEPLDLPPVSLETKPYFAPTNFDPDSPNPFGSALREAPMG